MSAPEEKKFNLPAQEEKILEFWEKNKIFERSIAQRKLARRFVFYDGPPFATGFPHYGHILASTIKDVVPRYWTMRGFRVDRRWGWDCHGLPIEHLVEQELKISGRKAIELFGIKKFNETARSKVLTYAKEWHKTIRRIGRFVDFENSYKTMDVTYMESVWWAFVDLYKKGLVYKDSRISLFCPRCETPLSNFEIAMDNSYRDQEDDSVYVKLPLKNSKNEFLLVWTTTPWTLPGNTAVAVNQKLEYTKYRVGSEYIWSATPPHETDEIISIIEKCSGKSLIGLKYEPPFRLSKDPSVYRVVGADFVDIKEGTGLVHIAPAFGEEDFVVGKKENLPVLETLDADGRFKSDLSGLTFLGGMGTAEANPMIIEKLKSANYLFKVHRIVHRYPICWRCQTSLIFKVQPAWFIKISAIRPKMLKLNEKIDWHPEHLKYGRFGKDLETAPDWNVSRSRFWGTPIPIWECTGCKKIQVISSREEFNKRSGGPRNRYFIMRHGEALSNLKNIVSYSPDGKYRETLRGLVQDEKAAKKLKSENIDLIFSSDVLRTRQTAEIVAGVFGIKKVHVDPRLTEIRTGIFEGKHPDEYHKYFSSLTEKFTKPPPGGETLTDVRRRALFFIQDLEKRYSGKNILIVSHEYPLWILFGAAMGLSDEETVALRKGKRDKEFIKFAEVMELHYRNVPRNERGEGDLHLPYVDAVKVFCECGLEAKRVPDVFDCWVESGSMPFAEHHYPFENQKFFEKNLPADFVSEYIAQTRGWFSRLHVLSTALFSKPAFKHVVTTGTILSETGEKLSKSRKNFPDPWLLLGRYGADAMRYYLMISPVMLGDNINFSEKDVDEVYKKYSLIAYNVLNFFNLYKYKLKGPHTKIKSAHILDRWILSRLHTTIREVTDGFDSYEVIRAVRPLLDFVQDLSLWYVRRSRGRVKSDSPDAAAAIRTLHNVLFDFSRLIAPVTPFLAEIVYQDLRKKKTSVHLEDWPNADRRFMNKDLEERMAWVREIVSEALRKRAEAGIRVRQPLARLEIKNQPSTSRAQVEGKSKIKNKELLDLIKDEVNVKEITFGDELKLDTTITPELKKEGIVREFVRNIQEMRRDLGLKPKQVVAIQISGDRSIEGILEKWEKTIKSETNSKELKIGGKKIFRTERELEIDDKELWAGIS